MISLFRKVAVAALSATVMAGALVPAQAMPLVAAPAATVNVQTDVTPVQYRDHRRGYYRGHRGYRHHRSGYRQHDGYWFPLAAFGAGALIGGAIAAQPRYVEPAPVYRSSGINPQHYEWCQMQYRSYDSYSNTFQPYHGPRQTCLSPYY
ncbi:MAG: BA14K family protein [Pseudorhizobium sp.]